MEVILLKDVEKLGYADEIVNVKPGYANNFLIPQGYAKAATASARKVLAENIKQRAHKEAKLVADAEALVAKVEGITVTIPVKAEEGKIFGSVTATNLADALSAQGIEVDRRNITVPQVKVIGEHEASVRFYKGIAGTLKFNVVAEE
ncbi:MAG: 50S ribosomal protein L9 [Alistipes sp.]|nr:50S ribosomal protein L9 [Alistipes sp.]